MLASVGPGGSLRPLLGAVVLLNLLAATQDIATDGLAVDMLEPPERGLANGVQVAGYRVGMIVGGGALLILFATASAAAARRSSPWPRSPRSPASRCSSLQRAPRPAVASASPAPAAGPRPLPSTARAPCASSR